MLGGMGAPENGKGQVLQFLQLINKKLLFFDASVSIAIFSSSKLKKKSHYKVKKTNLQSTGNRYRPPKLSRTTGRPTQAVEASP